MCVVWVFFFSIFSSSFYLDALEYPCLCHSLISTGDLVTLKLYAVNTNTIVSSAAANRRHRRE